MNSNNTKAFHDNELEANKYTAKCMLIMVAVVAIIWVLNLVGLFIVPQDIMSIAAVGSMLLLLVPTILQKVIKKYSKHTKIYNMICCLLAITLLASAMPKHGIVAWVAPVALSCHYYSKKFSYITFFASVLFMGVSLILGALYGEWDVATFGVGSVFGERTMDATVIRRLLLFMWLPRSMILAGITSVCVTLSARTHTLLETQINDSMEKQRIASELDVATKIQASMLPCIFPAFPERKQFEIYASMHPAKEVGGDFYDFFMVDEDNLAIVIADVSGKGVPAALFMVIGKTLIKDHTTSGKNLGQVFTEVNDLLCESNSEQLFITAFMGVLNIHTGEFRYVNAGHEMPYISRANQPFELYKIKPAFVLAGMEGVRYKEGILTLQPGDKLFQYTDGVTEATDKNECLFGLERLQVSLTNVKENSPKAILDAVKEDISTFVDDAPQFDDITMLCLEYKGD